jgi:hypothetical protein
VFKPFPKPPGYGRSWHDVEREIDDWRVDTRRMMNIWAGLLLAISIATAGAIVVMIAALVGNG